MQKERKKVILESIAAFGFFFVIGIVTWQLNDHIFFIFNFSYIGLAVAVGELLFGLLPREKKVWGRKISQLLVGLYLFGVLGLLARENMQIEGFWFYLFAGVFSGPVLHYLIAKIGGTFLFGRGWCGWACWTMMVLDFFPWSRPANGRLKGWGVVRYFHFAAVLALVSYLSLARGMTDFVTNRTLAFTWLLAGNLVYYMVAIVLAALLRDNRAFCKYVCPITVFLKAGARFSLWKIGIDPEKCSECRACERHCPMNIKLLAYMKQGKRITSTECIACQTCVNVCPEEAVSYSWKADAGWIEYLQFKK